MFRYDSQPASARSAAREDGFGLTDIAFAVWRRKWLIAGLAAAFGGLTAAYSASLPNRYQSTAQLLVDPRDLRVIGNDVSPNNLNSDSIAAYIESQTRIFTSTDTLRKIVDREALTRDSDYTSTNSVLARLLPARTPGDQTLAVMEQLRRNLWVRRGEKTFIIDVSVIASTPEKSARLTNAFANAFLEDQSAARADQSRRTSQSLTSRLSELRDRVRASEDKVETYKAQKNIVGASGKLVTEEQLAQLNSQLAFARSRVADARSKLEQADSVRGQAAERGAIPEAVNSQTLGILRQQLGEAQRRAASLQTSLGPQHPDILSAQNTLRDAQRAVGEEIGRIRQAARADFDRAVANERGLVQQVEQLKRETLSTSRDTVELRELERELESNRAIYQAFLTRARETRELEGVDTTNIRVITTAVPPLERVGPQRRLMVVGAAFGGAALGILLAVLGELLRWLKSRRPDMPADALEPVEAPANVTAAHSPATAPAYVPDAAQSPNPATHWQAQAFAQPVAEPIAAATAASGAPSGAKAPESQAQTDLMRVLRMMGQLEKAIDRYGMPR
jgi:uncharacterized protein involved in exopolysaccharide biosynthesis